MPVEPAFNNDNEPRSLFSDLREWLPSYTEHSRGSANNPIILDDFVDNDPDNPFITANRKPVGSQSGSINANGRVIINKGR